MTKTNDKILNQRESCKQDKNNTNSLKESTSHNELLQILFKVQDDPE